MTTSTEVLPGQDILGLLMTSGMPEIEWQHEDDLCDCVFQRVGFWTNPYIARTLEVRMCCIWADIYKQYPQFVREIPASANYNNDDVYEVKPVEWDSEGSDMPRAIWYRQLAVQHSLPLSAIRVMYENEESPKAVLKSGS